MVTPEHRTRQDAPEASEARRGNGMADLLEANDERRRETGGWGDGQRGSVCRPDCLGRAGPTLIIADGTIADGTILAPGGDVRGCV